MNKKTFISIFLLFFLLLAGCASGPSKSQENISRNSMFLWKMKKGQTVFYFLGSFHLGTREIYPLNDTINEAYNRSEALIVELDISASTQQTQLQQLLLKYSLFPGSETIRDYASPELIEKVDSILNQYEMNIETLIKMKPWFLENLISVLELQKQGYDPKYGIDVHFLNRAAKDDKNIIELETAEEQIALLASTSLEVQLMSLEITLKELSSMPVLISELIKHWKNGDIEKFENLFFLEYQKDSSFKEVSEKLLAERNINWVKKIDELLPSGATYFMVVGAGHMVGKNNIIELLRKKGYKIDQL